MSLFKERAASSKKIVALENEIINLKQQLVSFRNKSPKDSQELDQLKEENLNLKQQLESSLASNDLLSEIQKILD